MNIFGISLFVFCLLASCIECAPKKDVTGERLKALRNEMNKFGYSAYIVPSEDEHQSEYVAGYDKRRSWISGFTGSAGTAVVTLNKAAVWTDGRYYLQASQELDDNWMLMKPDFPGVPTLENWIVDELKSAANKTVGLNARFTSISDWKRRESLFNSFNLNLTSPDTDLIDLVWTGSNGRPAKPNSKIFIHNITYAGKTWQKKVEEVVSRTKDAGADIYVVTALDEVAWLFNMRASDVPYNPMFFAYAIVDVTGAHKLYVQNTSRIVNDTALTAHLTGATVLPYDQVFKDIEQYSRNGKIAWVSPMSSYAILNAVFNKNLLINNKASPIRSIKAVKNDVEIKGTRECQIRDSAYRIRHMYWLEEQMKQGKYLTEISVADELEKIQGEDKLFRGLSFNSISAVGAHASVIHYGPTKETDWELKSDKIFLLDAGAQYEDCTSDITRTHHYGKPSEKEILTYTKVLQGVIDLADFVFPPSVRGKEIDVAARGPLWRLGLDYGHGTGHGIGYFLSVHESPPRTNYKNTDPYDEPFAVGMIQSDEPGYYEDDEFGIRLETDIEVVKANTPYNFRNITYLKFEAQTLVPFEANLIDVKLLTTPQINWLNRYNQQIRDKVGPYLKKLGQEDVYQYMLRKTEPFKLKSTFYSNGAIRTNMSSFLIACIVLITMCISK